MKPRRRHPRVTSPSPPDPPLDHKAIDALYGLEPAFEPDQGAATADGSAFVTLQCPYCGEPFDTLVDLSAGTASYIEDCQVCCQPVELQVRIGDNGRLSSVTARRGD